MSGSAPKVAKVPGGGQVGDGSHKVPLVESAEGTGAGVAPGASEEPSAGKFPVKWTDELELVDVSGIAKALEKSEPDGLGSLSILDDVKEPTSCVQWSRLHEQGYEPETTADMHADGFARARCLTLEWLRRARPAATSHLRSLAWSPELVRWLPPTVVATADPDRFKAAEKARRLPVRA